MNEVVRSVGVGCDWMLWTMDRMIPPPGHGIILLLITILYYLLLLGARLGVLLLMATNTYYVTTSTTSLLQPDARTDGFFWKLPFTIIPIGGKRSEWRRRRRLAGVRRRLVLPAKIVTRGPHSPIHHPPSRHPPLRTATNHQPHIHRHPTWMDHGHGNVQPLSKHQHPTSTPPFHPSHHHLHHDFWGLVLLVGAAAA